MIRKSYLKQLGPWGLLCVLLLLASPFVQAQEAGTKRTITVTDSEGKMPLPGATVTNLKTNASGTTSAAGVIDMDAAVGDSISVRMIGYLKATVAVGADLLVKVELIQEQETIGEVVVTALGIKRETRGLTFATQQLGAEAVNEVRDNSGNVMTSLTGKVAGATITTPSTGPGAAVKVVLRGNKSIANNNNALVVVDGVPYDNSPGVQATGTTPNYGTSDGAANINPDDIESVNILKGPSAAALYGSRAANGAVIITTKQGRAGRYQIDYNGSASIDQVNMLTQFQNRYGRGNGGVVGTNVGESWGAPGTTYSDNVRNVFQNAATFNNSISAYGGSEKINGYMSYANNRIGGITPGNDLKRNTVNVRLNTELIPKLKTDVKLTYMNQQIDNRPRLGDMGLPVEAYIMPRDMSDEEAGNFETINPSNGQPRRAYWSGSTLYDNPYWSLNRTSVNEERNRVTALGSASYELTEGLSLLGRYTYDRYNDVTYGSFHDGTVSLGNVRAGGMYYETHTSYWEQNLDILLNGKNTLSDNIQLNYNVGTSFFQRNFDSFQNMANGLSVANQFSFRMATTPEFLLINRFRRQMNSVFASAQLAFYDNIFLDLTARNDWSSTLPSPHSFFYPSAGLGIVFNEWLNLPSWVNFGKVRASYAFVGNDVPPYNLAQLYNFGLGAGQGFISRSPTRATPDLLPERTESLELGLEMKFLNNIINFDAVYYKANTINQFIPIALPMASGFSRASINAGNLENSGFEFELSATPVKTNNFSWNTAINFSANRNRVLYLEESTQRVNVTDNARYATVVVAEGGRYGDLYGHAWARDEATGKFIVDARGLPVVVANQKIGNFNPDALIGWSNSFAYKNFTLRALIDARIGGEIVSGTAGYLAAFGVADFTEQYREGNWVIDAVTADGQANTTAITAQQFWTTVSQAGRDGWGEFFIYDMTNVRLRELALTYKFNLESVKAIKAAQVSLTGRNLFFFYRGKSKLDIPGLGKLDNPIDPEGALGAGNYQGVELGLPPAVRTFGLNVKLTF